MLSLRHASYLHHLVSLSPDSLVPVPNKRPRPSSLDPQEEVLPKCNNHVPSLADQFKELLPSTTNEPPQPMIDIDLEQHPETKSLQERRGSW
jgi:hypothetical protein